MSFELVKLVWASDVGPSAKRMTMLALAEKARDDTAQAWPSIAHLADMTQLGRSTVRKHLGELEREGYIKREFRPDRSTLYTINVSRFRLRPWVATNKENAPKPASPTPPESSTTPPADEGAPPPESSTTPPAKSDTPASKIGQPPSQLAPEPSGNPQGTLIEAPSVVASPPRGEDKPTITVQAVVAGWVDAIRSSTGRQPSKAMRAQVGKEAKACLATTDPTLVLQAAQQVGGKGYATLERELAPMLAKQQRANEPEPPWWYDGPPGGHFDDLPW